MFGFKQKKQENQLLALYKHYMLDLLKDSYETLDDEILNDVIDSVSSNWFETYIESDTLEDMLANHTWAMLSLTDNVNDKINEDPENYHFACLYGDMSMRCYRYLLYYVGVAVLEKPTETMNKHNRIFNYAIFNDMYTEAKDVYDNDDKQDD